MAKTHDKDKRIFVEVPDLDELKQLQQNAVILEAMLVAKFRRKKRRFQVQKLLHALQQWDPAIQRKKPIKTMMAYLRCIKQIQRFVRWALRHLREVRAGVEANWQRLEGHTEKARRAANAAGHQEADATHEASNRQRAVHFGDHSPAHGQHHPDNAAAHGEADQTLGQVTRSVRRLPSIKAEAKNTATVEERRRRVFLAQELRTRRKKYLPVYEVWLGDMQLYWRDVFEWRRWYRREDCLTDGTRLMMPERPPRPSHLPSDEQLLELARQYKLQAKDKQSEGQRKDARAATVAVGRVGRLALIAGIEEKKPDEDLYKAADAVGGEDLCEEITSHLAPTASHPSPEALTSVDRPMLPSPV